jgi:FkbM family methyltransferase
LANKEKYTLLKIVQQITELHPELHQSIEEIIFKAQGKNRFDANFLLALYRSILRKSQSQIRQDLFVLHQLNFKQNGYFVEFGATNGIDLSNSYLLETEYGWNGILVEPAKVWHPDLLKNRRAKIDTRCVYKTSGESILFNESKDPNLSVIDSFSGLDNHTKLRSSGNQYFVETISLIDLLNQYSAPEEIDYLSIDTEGSEFDILENFDFKKYRFKVITCEHNYTANRERLNALFVENGYHKKYENFSLFDDWWVLG